MDSLPLLTSPIHSDDNEKKKQKKTSTTRYHNKSRLREIITNVTNCIVIAAEGFLRFGVLMIMIMTPRHDV